MADSPKNMAASVKARLLTMSREQGRAFDLLLVRFALERLLFRLSLSPHRDNYVLKGGMLVTQWLKHDNRETRDIDFLGFGPDDKASITAIFAEIMTIETGDGLVFDVDALAASAIREEMEYGGIRLKTSAYLERTRIPVTLDVGFGDALADATRAIDYPSLLNEPRPTSSRPRLTAVARRRQPRCGRSRQPCVRNAGRARASLQCDGHVRAPAARVRPARQRRPPAEGGPVRRTWRGTRQAPVPFCRSRRAVRSPGCARRDHRRRVQS